APAVWAYTRSGLYESTNGGNTWSLSTAHVATDLCPAGFCYRAGVAYDPASPSTIYASNDQGFVSKTVDGGTTWSPLTPPTQMPDAAAFIAVGSDHTIFANVDDLDLGTVLIMSRDSGATWSFCNPSAEPGGNFSGLAGGIRFDPTTPGTVYLA